MIAQSTVLVFGTSLTNAEFQLLLEIVKVALLAAGGGAIAFLFNIAAKNRELDKTLFNELVKPRIACLQELNGSIIAAVTAYEDRVDALLNPPVPKQQAAGVAGVEAISNRDAIEAFRNTELPAKLENLRRAAKRSRYKIGEHSYQVILGRIDLFGKTLKSIWGHYNSVSVLALINDVGEGKLGVEKAVDKMHEEANVHALVSRRQIKRLIHDLHDDFESVIMSRRSRTRPIKDPVTEWGAMETLVATLSKVAVLQLEARAAKLEEELEMSDNASR